jgi:hypothetical protein
MAVPVGRDAVSAAGSGVLVKLDAGSFPSPHRIGHGGAELLELRGGHAVPPTARGLLLALLLLDPGLLGGSGFFLPLPFPGFPPLPGLLSFFSRPSMM